MRVRGLGWWETAALHVAAASAPCQLCLYFSPRMRAPTGRLNVLASAMCSQLRTLALIEQTPKLPLAQSCHHHIYPVHLINDLHTSRITQ